MKAGKKVARTGDHPRLCGEKFGRSTRQLYRVGSPPPMRGKVHAVPKVVFVHGITPAYAGKRRHSAAADVA